MTARQPPELVARTLAALVGRQARLTFAADPSYGVTCRWAVVREVSGSTAVLDGYHDSSGCYGEYPDHRGDGVRVDVASILAVRDAAIRDY